MGDNIPVVSQIWAVTCGHRSTSSTVLGPPEEETHSLEGERNGQRDSEWIYLLRADATKE